MTANDTMIVEPFALTDALSEALENYKIIYAVAPTGWGKTTVMLNHFREEAYTYVSFWDDDAMARAEQDTTGLVILDDCHALASSPKLQKQVCALLRTVPNGGHAVILSRAPVPEWLLPFQISGLLTVLESDVFTLGTEDIARLAEAMGIILSQEDVVRLYQDSRGHPLAVRLICMELAAGKPLNNETVQRAHGRLYTYLESDLLEYWDTKTRRLVLTISFFPSFTVDLARVLTGDSQVEQTLNHLLSISSFMEIYGDSYEIRYPPFREYLRHKAESEWSVQEINAMYTNAGTYFQLHGDLPSALECFSKSGNHAKLCELLVEHSKQHPGHGVYYQLRKYYRSLTDEEIMSSPELMCGMSILSSLTFEIEESERWYTALKSYTDGLSRRNPERKAAQGLICYLDIALPHRGSINLQSILLTVYEGLTGGSVSLPEFSVTSNLPSILRGGKDFSSWVSKDKLLYKTIRTPVELLLGRAGVGLPDVALTESRYEKGEDISGEFLTLASRRGEIQRKGAPEIEFVLAALLAKCQCDRGAATQAAVDIKAFRTRMINEGHTHLLPNINAFLCRIAMLTDGEYAYRWYVEEAPDENDFFIMERYRYLTKVRCYIRRGNYLTALSLLGRLLDYFQRYDRTLDKIETLCLIAICRYRMGNSDWHEYMTEAMELGKEYGFVRVFAHQGAAFMPLIRAWQQPKSWDGADSKYLAKIRTMVRNFTAMYSDYMMPSNDCSLESLTKKEMEVLRLMCRGKSSADIREILCITDNTLKTHSRRLFKKMGVNSRIEAVAVAQRNHLL